MSTYPLSELLHRWSLGELTAEQAIGHLMQHLQAQEKRLAEAVNRIHQLEQRPTAKV